MRKHEEHPFEEQSVLRFRQTRTAHCNLLSWSEGLLKGGDPLQEI